MWTHYWPILLLILVTIYLVFISKRDSENKKTLMASPRMNKTERMMLQQVLKRLNHETRAFLFQPKQIFKLQFRGHQIPLIAGQVGYLYIRRWPTWGNGEMLYIVLPLEEEAWARDQRDVFEHTFTGSEAAIFIVRNAVKLAAEAGK